MRNLVRVVVLWILVVALPAQGIAAAVALPCAIAHGAAASPGAVDDCDDVTMMPAHAERLVGDHGAHRGVPCDQGGDRKHSSCRACAACCAGATAPPPFAFAGLQARHVAAYYMSSVPSFTGWVPSRIERPPRA